MGGSTPQPPVNSNPVFIPRTFVNFVYRLIAIKYIIKYIVMLMGRLIINLNKIISILSFHIIHTDINIHRYRYSHRYIHTDI